MSCELKMNFPKISHKLSGTDYHILRCDCGWQFLSLTEWATKCPQCKDIIKMCVCCGDDISHKTHRARYCDNCMSAIKKINAKYNMQKQRSNLKESIGDICNYDCANCQFSDCILPVDPDDKQEELFR